MFSRARSLIVVGKKFNLPRVGAMAMRNMSSVVSIETAKAMPKAYGHMPNDILLTMAVMGDQDAKQERLIREIMSVDSVSWTDAHDTLEKIIKSNRSGLFMFTLPYKIGIASSVLLGFGCIPLIYHLDSVLWFNEAFVTSDIPDDKDLETPLEVSSWAWNWMEPSLGTLSFTLLCMQYARNQLQNLDAKPYTQMMLERRADRVASEFPAYSAMVVRDFSITDSLSPH